MLVANHRSFMDTPVALGHIPLEFRFFAKHGLFHVPFIGWYLRRAGHLPVYRGDPRASVKTLVDGARLIREKAVCRCCAISRRRAHRWSHARI